MHKPFIQNQIRRCNRNFLISNILMILIVGLMASYYDNELYNAYAGPFEVEANEIASITDINQVKKIHVKFELEYVKKLESLDVYDIHLMKVANKYVMVTSFPNEPILSTTISGTLYQLDQEKGIYDALNRDPQFQHHVLPFMLDTTGLLEKNMNALLSMCSPFLILFLINIARYLNRISHPTKHKIYKRLQAFGDVEQVTNNINAEMDKAQIHHKHYYVTPSWIIREDLFTIKIAKNYGKETNVLETTFK